MKRSGNGSHLFLTELVVCLSLFVISAAVCVGLLVHARSMSLESTRLNQAVYLAQSTAEAWRAGEQVLPSRTDDSGLTVSALEHDGTLTVSVSLDGKPVFSLEEVARLG